MHPTSITAPRPQRAETSAGTLPTAFERPPLEGHPVPTFQPDGFLRAAELQPALEAVRGSAGRLAPFADHEPTGADGPTRPATPRPEPTWAYPHATAQEAVAPRAAAPVESEAARKARERLALVARRASSGRRPDGRCYHHVWRFLTWVGGYGKVVQKGIPASHARYARQFAELVNRNPAAYGLRKLALDNPYLAPAGALVVVRPGAPGTRHPKAGDIAVADGTGRFFNGGEMRYGGPGSFPPGNRHVLGIYVPA
ncbi:MAG: hypothetical protein VKQ33_09265 [Candidatus Sericytochromatia bacterium]|nr:hypothetical protein [Candidatus Sericytochromatia bacterium]